MRKVYLISVAAVPLGEQSSGSEHGLRESGCGLGWGVMGDVFCTHY